MSNFGGFLVGFLFALIGGALAVSWAPGAPAADDPGDEAELPDGAPGSDGDEVERAGWRLDGPAVPEPGQGPLRQPRTGARGRTT